jgi:hypothetical protein
MQVYAVIAGNSGELVGVCDSLETAQALALCWSDGIPLSWHKHDGKWHGRFPGDSVQIWCENVLASNDIEAP